MPKWVLEMFRKIIQFFDPSGCGAKALSKVRRKWEEENKDA